MSDRTVTATFAELSRGRGSRWAAAFLWAVALGAIVTPVAIWYAGGSIASAIRQFSDVVAVKSFK